MYHVNWFAKNSQHQKRYSEGGKKTRGYRGLLGREVQCQLSVRTSAETQGQLVGPGKSLNGREKNSGAKKSRTLRS